MGEIMVTVYCLAFNHGKYIRKCLEGFIHQKTTFEYEVLIHDDASTDNTADIIREYELKYPQIIHPIYQKTNQYSQHIPISKTFLVPMTRGRYIAFCDGDDYWSEESKLQNQFDAMENNPECHICLHRVQGIKECGEMIINNTYPHIGSFFSSGKISAKQLVENSSDPYQFQFSSYFVIAKDYINYIYNPPDFKKLTNVGDVPLLLYCASLGDAIFVDKYLSHYRRFSIGSWTSRFKMKSRMDLANYYEVGRKFFEEYDKFTNFKFHDALEKKIQRNLFNQYECLGNYFECLSKNLRIFIYERPFRARVSFFLRAYYQWICRLVNSIFS